jgi:hypothetical protein
VGGGVDGLVRSCGCWCSWWLPCAAWLTASFPSCASALGHLDTWSRDISRSTLEMEHLLSFLRRKRGANWASTALAASGASGASTASTNNSSKSNSVLRACADASFSAGSVVCACDGAQPCRTHSEPEISSSRPAVSFTVGSMLSQCAFDIT